MRSCSARNHPISNMFAIVNYFTRRWLEVTVVSPHTKRCDPFKQEIPVMFSKTSIALAVLVSICSGN